MIHAVETYARAVVAGTVPAGKYHRFACARHLADLERAGTPGFPYRFDAAAADRFTAFAGLLKHYKGEWSGQPITLSPNQVFRLGSIFGWRHVGTGLRRFTTSYNELPRKSGKSLESAVVAVYVTFFEGEPGAEGYVIATKLSQAKIVFSDAKKLIKSSGLASRLTVNAWNLHHEGREQKMEPLGSDYSSTDGLNPHCIITDEFHAMKTRDLIDVMESATGARRNPLHYQITTAGDDLVSPCGDQHDYCCKILDGTLADDPSTVSFFGFIAHADDGDAWQDEATWIKANPHWGISVKPEDMRKLAAKAKNMPSAAAEFQQKRLNVWINATAPCLSLDGWRNGQTKHDSGAQRAAWIAELEHESCYVGIDLASKIDLCALSLVFPPAPGRPKWRVFQHLWTPKATIAERAHRDRAPYQVWVEKGWLQTTDGTRIDHDVIKTTLLALRSRFDIERIGFDPWHADKLIEELIAEGFREDQVLAVPQTYQGMSSGCLEMQAEILGANVDAGGCPVTAWAVSNTVGQSDGKQNLMFAKGKSRGRIDPVIAPTIGMALWKRFGEQPSNVYSERGVRSLSDYLA